MEANDSISIKTGKKSTFSELFKVFLIILGFVTLCFIIYKAIQKIKKWLKEKHFAPYVKVDIDGDGEADAVLFDTTGDGNIDTIVLAETK